MLNFQIEVTITDDPSKRSSMMPIRRTPSKVAFHSHQFDTLNVLQQQLQRLQQLKPKEILENPEDSRLLFWFGTQLKHSEVFGDRLFPNAKQKTFSKFID